jgi:hypothetical protein
MRKRVALTVRMPSDLKDEIESAICKSPVPSFNQFLIEACKEKLSRMK